ncbi:MAG TPA: ERF family protein, partial [Candidatus Woesebacteria bacterium]|nr:ERF family protein [Candidatus Woesebacteria bacterium]
MRTSVSISNTREVRMYQSEVTKALFEALLKVQGQLKPAAKDGENPHHKSTYSTLKSVVEACEKLLIEHQLIRLQTVMCKNL